MFDKIISIFTSNSRNNRLFQILLILSIILIIVILYKRRYSPSGKEGFSQSDRYILRENDASYDDFYSQIYDKLMLPLQKSEYVMGKIISMTQPNKDYSAFLDVGSGTGSLVAALRSTGYKAYGLDKSQAMVDQSKERIPNAAIKCGDVLDSITYDRGSFTHIICSGKTLYELKDKLQFFKNAYFWLQGNGYLIIELIDKDTFDTVIPGGNPGFLDGQVNKYSETRITDTLIDFLDFTYHSSFRFNENTVIHKEIFTDTATKNIRENERVLEIENPNDIIKMATTSGFIVKGKASMDSPGEYLYIFERLN